ncbi:hypothetical protein [Brachyspira sp.]|uniref:hypothetical protein n=1 Tax=Brachyspira sp. TaxID=1977261 RepID=UPI003D7CBC79
MLPESQITDETFNLLKKDTMDAIDEVKDFRESIAKRVIGDCNKELQKYAKEMHEILIGVYTPNFTETDFESIKLEEKSNEEVYGTEEIEKGITFTKIEKVPFYHKNKHVKLVSESIYKRFDGIISDISRDIITYTTNCISMYRDKLTEHKDKLKSEYDKLLEDKDNNDKRIAQIKSWEENLSIVEEKNKKIEELKGELKSC